MKFGILWHSDLDGKAKARKLSLAQLDDTIKQQFPIAIARKIIIGDEEAFNALGMVLADDFFTIVRRAKTALTALHVDDGAERTLIRTAPPKVDTGERA